MDENYATFLVFSIGAVSLFSYMAVSSWANARRLEREAYYRSEAIKKLAEMQGTIPEAVLQLLRDALPPPPLTTKPVSASLNPAEYRRERDAYHRNETLKRFAATGVGAEAALQYLRDEERNEDRRRRTAMRDGLRLGGLISTAAGIGLMVFLWGIVPEKPVYFVGLIPLLVGFALIGFASMLVRESEAVSKR